MGRFICWLLGHNFKFDRYTAVLEYKGQYRAEKFVEVCLRCGRKNEVFYA